MKTYSFTRVMPDGSTVTDTVEAENLSQALYLYRELLANIPA